MTTFSVKFLGCKVSHSDMMLARSHMLEAGHTEVAEDEAEIHVVNTCCITREAEAKSRQATRQSLKKTDGGRVFVTGCAANLNIAQFDEIATSVTALSGRADDVAKKLVSFSGPSCIEGTESSERSPSLGSMRTRGFVKIQDGCDGRCTYCIVPKVRGGARSIDADAVIDEVRKRVQQGQPEMVITGISVGDYCDHKRGWDLGQLMRQVACVNGVERVRLSSVEVTHVNDSLVEALQEEPKICPHLHLPLQSGDDGVLEAMGRRYSSHQYLQVVRDLRERVPGLNVTTDVIVGFPSEDDDAFERTCDCVRDAAITKVHTFSFSSRPGTQADKLIDAVEPGVKKERSKKMRKLSEEMGQRYRSALTGTERLVLIDKVANSQISGYTSDYVRVHMEPGTAKSGQLVGVAIEKLHADGVRGVVIEPRQGNL